MRTLVASVAVASLLLAACAGDDDGGGAPDPERPITFGGARSVMLQVPSTFDPARTYPLLLILHGYSGNGFVQQAFLGLQGVADREELFVLAPDGTVDSQGKQFWNADPVCCDFGNTGVDDVAYLGGLIEDVRAAWPVDPARIWVVGHSNGSYMAYRLACERADVVTAIAGLAGAAASVPASCTPSRAVHVLHMHGTDDDTVPYEDAGVRLGALTSVTQWAGHDGCTGAIAAAGRKDLDDGLPGDETAVDAFAGCPADGVVELWTIEGGGHLPALAPSFPAELLGWLGAHTR